MAGRAGGGGTLPGTKSKGSQKLRNLIHQWVPFLPCPVPLLVLPQSHLCPPTQTLTQCPPNPALLGGTAPAPVSAA